MRKLSQTNHLCFISNALSIKLVFLEWIASNLSLEPIVGLLTVEMRYKYIEYCEGNYLFVFFCFRFLHSCTAACANRGFGVRCFGSGLNRVNGSAVIHQRRCITLWTLGGWVIFFIFFFIGMVCFEIIIFVISSNQLLFLY